MKQAYEIAIYKALCENLAKELQSLKCEMIIDVETLTYTFQNCPNQVIKKILKLKAAKGEISVLNEFIIKQS